eukprot:1060195-Pyramimonas_sp.AAC.1
MFKRESRASQDLPADPLAGKAGGAGAIRPKGAMEQPMRLRGDLSLVGLRLNQLIIAPSLHGHLAASPSDGMQLEARGRPDEYLYVAATPSAAPSDASAAEGGGGGGRGVEADGGGGGVSAVQAEERRRAAPAAGPSGGGGALFPGGLQRAKLPENGG